MRFRRTRANGFVHNEALAYELAARFYAARERGPGASVADAMTADIPTVNKSRCLEDAFRLLQGKVGACRGRRR